LKRFGSLVNSDDRMMAYAGERDPGSPPKASGYLAETEGKCVLRRRPFGISFL
jgi:hypothetical protein